MTRRQRRRRAAALDFGQAWNLLHALARAGFDDDRRLMIALARRCEETTTERSLRAASRKWAETYEAGRSVKFKRTSRLGTGRRCARGFAYVPGDRGPY